MDDNVRPYYRDYICSSSLNNYQSLHITFYDNSSRCYMEVQLRTKMMDDVAEIGTANHIGYEKGRQQTSAKPLTRVIIDKNLNFYTAFGNEDEMPIDLEELPAFLQRCAEKEPDMYVALYADEAVPYREIVRVLNIANENHFKMVLATRPPEKKR
jgi:biopolymer transport protein ExbD